MSLNTAVKSLIHLATLPAAAAVLMAGNAASSQTLYNNVPPIAGGVTGLEQVSVGGPLYDSFSTGATVGSLTEVTLAVNGASDSNSYSVYLLSDSAANPGSVLTTIGTKSDITLGAPPSKVNFVLATPYALSPNTRYWIELAGHSSSVAWGYSNFNGGIGVDGEYWAWSPDGSPIVFLNSDAETPYMMDVVAAAAPPPASTPEPGTYALVGSLTLTGAAFLRRRRTR